MTAINLTEMDREGVIRKVVEMGGDGVLKCIQCGACASVRWATPVLRSIASN